MAIEAANVEGIEKDTKRRAIKQGGVRLLYVKGGSIQWTAQGQERLNAEQRSECEAYAEQQ